MTILLSADNIKALVEDCDAAQMERYQKVAREAAAVVLDNTAVCVHAFDDIDCPGATITCRECRRAYLDREAK
jgi:hypothetical protein